MVLLKQNQLQQLEQLKEILGLDRMQKELVGLRKEVLALRSENVALRSESSSPNQVESHCYVDKENTREGVVATLALLEVNVFSPPRRKRDRKCPRRPSKTANRSSRVCTDAKVDTPEQNKTANRSSRVCTDAKVDTPERKGNIPAASFLSEIKNGRQSLRKAYAKNDRRKTWHASVAETGMLGALSSALEKRRNSICCGEQLRFVEYDSPDLDGDDSDSNDSEWE